MAQGTPGPLIGSAVMFVEDLDRSARFYTELLALSVADRSPTAVLLHSPAGAQLILRSMGRNAPHPSGAVGIQYMVWTAASLADLSRIEHFLKENSAHIESRSAGGAAAVEGRDPDGIVVMVSYPGPAEAPLHELPARIYGWL